VKVMIVPPSNASCVATTNAGQRAPQADADARERQGGPEEHDQQDVQPAGAVAQRDAGEHRGRRVGLDLRPGHLLRP